MFRQLALVSFFSAVAVTTAIGGPPWIAVEYPANPNDPNTRDAFCTIRTYRHSELTAYEVTGTAEGLVNGKRQTVPLDIRRLPQAGMYAIRWQKPAQGQWALVVSTQLDGNFMASALIDVDARGRIASVTVPSRSIEGGRWSVPRQVASSDLDALLKNQGR